MQKKRLDHDGISYSQLFHIVVDCPLLNTDFCMSI